MKKICAALLTLVLTFISCLYVSAGTFDGYWDFPKADGTYAYGFPRILVTLDENWYLNTRVIPGEGGMTASFYHKDSRDAYAKEGLDGGLLFTLGASVNSDFQNLPSFRYLGFDEEEAMNYYAELPTDYQAYVKDEKIRAEYDILWSGVEEVLDNVLIKGSEKYNKMHEPSTSEPTDSTPAGPITSGEYEYSVNEDKETVTLLHFSGDAEVMEIPSEIDGYPVSQIGPEAFSYRTMTSLTVPDSVQCIEKRAFEYSTVSDSIRLPQNITIMDDAFSYATLPSEITIPVGAVVEPCTFSYCEGLESVIIESDVTVKGRGFGYCYDLSRVVCAEGSRLEAEAFEYCKALEEAVLCGNVEMEEDAFSYCGDVTVTRKEAGASDTQGQSIPAGVPDTQGQSELADIIEGILTGENNEGDGKEDTDAIELEIKGSPADADGVTVTLTEAVAVKNDTGYNYSFSGTIENNTEEGIMEVIYTFVLMDETGEEFRSFGITYDGGDTPIAPHTKIDFNYDDIRWGLQSVPAAVSIGVSSVKTETELPPVNVPKTGEYLYMALGDEKLENIKNEPPVELEFYVDHGGAGRSAVFKEGELLDRAVELFCDIKIGEESGEFVTDNYNWITLTWADGSVSNISLNLNNLEYSVHSTIHTYRLENLYEFRGFADEYLG